LKILHIQGAAQLAGCERTCELFIDTLRGAKHSVLVVGSDGPAAEVWTKVGAEVEVIGYVPGRFKEHALISSVVRRERPDAVILWTSSRLGLKVAACHGAGAKRIAVHVGNPVELSAKNRMAAETYTALPGGRKATLIAVSKHVESSYHQEGGFRHLPSRVIYNGIALSQFDYDPHEYLPRPVRIGMVARLDPIKDHATLLRAWRRVLQSNPDWHLELAGDGPLRPKLEALADELGIRSNVHFLGWVSDIPAVMTEWSMVVHSTTRAEGLGNSVLEAMALGRPLVATDVSPILEMTDGGKVARISRIGDPDDLANQILDVEKDWERSRSMVAAARERIVEFFSPEHMVAEYLNCLGLEIQA